MVSQSSGGNPRLAATLDQRNCRGDYNNAYHSFTCCTRCRDCTCGASHADEVDWAKVNAALGKTASVLGSVHRYGIPRSDLQVTVDGVAIRPALALGGWLGFEPLASGALVMGDLVLTETEIEPVMTKCLRAAS